MISQKLANVKFQEMIPRKIPQKRDFSLGAVKIS